MSRIAARLAAVAALAAVPGQGRSQVVETAASLPTGVSVDDNVEYYDVPGDDLAQVVSALNGMRLEGPDGPPSQGLTQYWIEPAYDARAGGGACRVVDVEVAVEITITLPRWRGAVDRPSAEQARWQRIEQAIREHEHGHRALVVDAAGALHEVIDGLEARGCGALRDVVTRALSVADGRLKEAHAALDRATPRRLSVGPGS
jgi:predicted secreted Zn-dependent protease